MSSEKAGVALVLSKEEKKLSVVIFELLKNATSQQVVRDFLKSKGVPTSGNWEELYEKRIEPALNQLKFTIKDLRELLQTVEEYGRQHTFLFQCTPERAQGLINPKRVIRIATEEKLDSLFETPIDIGFPENPTIVDLRILQPDENKIPVSLTIKIVEKRMTKTFHSESINHEEGTITKKYNFTEKRAVNIATLDHEGILELRIASQDNSNKYTDLVRDMLSRIRKLIPHEGFSTVSLGPAKDKILKNREQLSREFRYSNSTAVNDLGAVMQISSSSQDDNLSSDDGSMAAIDSFLAGDGHVTGANVYAKIPNTEPQREIHVLLSGEVNEFAVPVACSAGEYSYVRGKVISLNT